MHKYGSGNCICFEMSYDHPITAGNQLQTKSYFFNLVNIYYSLPVKYADNDGFKDYISITFGTDSPTKLSTFPVLTASQSETIGRLFNLEYFKQPNEIFALNYELCFLPVDIQKDFIGQSFINNNALVNDDYDLGEEDTYIYYGTDEFVYSQLDTKAHGSNRVRIISMKRSEDPTTRVEHLRIYHEMISVYPQVSNWCIARENGDILFASNRDKKEGNYVDLYFFTRQKRI